MLEVFVTCLSRYAAYLKDKQLEEENKKRDSEAIQQDNELSESPKAPERKKKATRTDSLIRDPNIDSEEEDLGSLLMEGLTALLNANSSNCNVFRDCGGAKCVHGMVVYESCRSKALGKFKLKAINITHSVSVPFNRKRNDLFYSKFTEFEIISQKNIFH